jgi:hypothetical protein
MISLSRVSCWSLLENGFLTFSPPEPDKDFMRIPDAAEIDHIAAETANDIRTLCAVWTAGGSSALDAAVRGNAAWSFAVLDSRVGNSGVVKLLALRPALSAVLLVFGHYARRNQILVAFGLGDYDGFKLTANASLAEVKLTGGSTAYSAHDPPPAILAAEMAWRFDAGVDPAVEMPAEFVTVPADFERSACENPTYCAPALLSLLDAASAVLDGRISYSAGLGRIVGHRSACGLAARDRDMTAISAVECQSEDLDRCFEFRRKQTGGAWTWEEELASYEEFARKHGEAHCRSLIERFRGNAFAKT